MVSIAFLNFNKIGCFEGLCYAYRKNEKCGQLNDLIKFYIIHFCLGVAYRFVVFCISGTFLTILKRFLDKELEKSEKKYDGVQK